MSKLEMWVRQDFKFLVGEFVCDGAELQIYPGDKPPLHTLV